ncbi:MAG: alkaline phosphatase PhoX, partial [Cyanobacteria bacterium P01_A01_bin.17]
KHTWLGRYRHEAVAVRAVKGKKLAVYSGCDRRGGHLYKFVSQDNIYKVDDKANSGLLEQGMLYGAKLNPDGTGQWIALNPDTAVDPVLPSQVIGDEVQGLVTFPNPDRQAGGIVEVTQDADAIALQSKFKTLGDLYIGNAIEKQGAILIDAHFAANAAGVTCMARPEDTTVNAQGALFVAFTSGSPGSDGGPDKQIFTGPEGETPYEYGWIMKLEEDKSDPGSMTFRWEMIALGGEPADGGLGFSNPDNLEVDSNGNLWMVTDMSTSKHNQEIPRRTEEGEPVSQSKLRGLFGNNSAWVIPLSGPDSGKAVPFAIGPMECELCGLSLSSDQKSLFLAVQHPGETGGMRQDMASETRSLVMRTTDGQEFTQQRQVPLGSNWPGKTAQDPPKPALVVVQREDGQDLA